MEMGTSVGGFSVQADNTASIASTLALGLEYIRYKTTVDNEREWNEDEDLYV